MSALVAKGLAGMRAEKVRLEKEREEREKPRANYFNWKNNKNKDDKNVVVVRFMQEFSDSADTYNEDRGLPLMAVEHQAPGLKGYTRRASCTLESEGQCYACERHAQDKLDVAGTGRKTLGWHQRRNFYIWALVDYNDGQGPQLVVISRTFGSSFVDDLLLEVEEDPENKITDKMWKITKTGSKKQTAWKLRKVDVDLYDDSELEVPDLDDSVLRKIPYDDQPGYFGQVWKDGDPVEVDDDDDEPKAETRQKSGELSW